MDKRNVLSALALGVGIAALLKKDSSVVPSTNPNARTGEEEGNKIINNTYGADFYKGANRILATDLGLNTSKVDNYSVLMSAIDRAAEGDEIYLPNGTFNLKQQLDIEKSGVRLILAKNATLNFNPTSSTDNGIRIRGFDNAINGGKINVNDKVENAIFVQGNGSRNRILDIVMESTVRTAGQRAIYCKAIADDDEATYFNRIINLDVINFGEGVFLDTESNATFVDNVTFTRTLTGIHIVAETVMCMISNVLFQGHYAPTGDEYGIRCYGDSNVFSNIMCEIISGAGIKFEAGANFNIVNGVSNTQAAKPYIDLGADNNIQGGDNIKTKYITMNQHLASAIPNGSLFMDTADNRLKFKFYDGTTRVITWT